MVGDSDQVVLIIGSGGTQRADLMLGAVGWGGLRAWPGRDAWPGLCHLPAGSVLRGCGLPGAQWS